MSQNSSSTLTAAISQMSFVVALVVGGLITAFYYYNIYDDGTAIEAKIANMKTQETAEKDKKKKTEKVLAEQEALKLEVGGLADQFREISSKLPIQIRNQELIDSINMIARQAGVRVVSIKPETIAVRENYDEYPTRVEVRGTFSSIVTFIYYLSSVERITNLGDLNFTNESGAYNGIIKLDTVIYNYRYRPPVEKETDPKKANEPKKNSQLDSNTEMIKELT